MYEEEFLSPKYTWSMTMGDVTIYHIEPINWWRRFWLRFMGWKVNQIKN